MVKHVGFYSATRKDINPEREATSELWVNPTYRFFFPEWRLIRDAIEGERDIKDGRELYLSKLEGMDNEDYESYLDRATFYNFTGRTISALIGTLFRRKHKITGLPTALEPRLDNISQAGSSFDAFAETTAEEYMTTGRYGVLLDLPAVPSVTPTPYMVPYIAENILDWEWGDDPNTGRKVLVRIVLREWVRRRTDHTAEWVARYRVLVLEPQFRNEARVFSGPRVYVQYEYDGMGVDGAPLGVEVARRVPLIRAEPLTYLPFHLFEAPRPPLLDIARLNISHYRSYAHLEHGRYFTGLPVYVVAGEGASDSYYIGPSVVWNIPSGGDAKILEFNGNGLRALEGALRDKEAQAASLGGRMIGVTSQATAETDNQTAMKDRNEQALLHRASRVLDHGFTILMRWWADFSGEPAPRLRVVFNKAFLYDAIGSREFRAIQSMYKDNILPIEVVYDYMVKAGVIDEELVSVDDLKTMLESEDSFPNNPDFAARKAGYPNAQAQITDENKDRELDIEEDTLNEDIAARKSADKRADEGVKTQRMLAKNPPPAPPGGPPAPNAPPRGGPPAPRARPPKK